MIGLVAFVLGIANQPNADASSDLAYIAVTPDGFVDGACFTESPDTKEWLNEMKRAGLTIQRVPRQQAKALWGTYLPFVDPHSESGSQGEGSASSEK